MDLCNIGPGDIDFAEMAAGLSKLARFNGRYRDPSYSVAQHSVMGADALYNETGDAVLAGCFLIHDGHEYQLGDWVSPAIDALDHWLVKLHDGHERQRPLQRAVRQAAALAKQHIDHAVYAAAGLSDYPRLYPVYARQVRDMDERMLRAEGLALFGPKAGKHLPAAKRQPPRLTGGIISWGAMKAEELFLDRLYRYLGIMARPV